MPFAFPKPNFDDQPMMRRLNEHVEFYGSLSEMIDDYESHNRVPSGEAWGFIALKSVYETMLHGCPPEMMRQAIEQTIAAAQDVLGQSEVRSPT